MGASPQADASIPRLEPLEPRVLLSAAEWTGLSFVGPFDAPDWPAGVEVLPPEAQSGAADQAYDMGDHYWYYDQAVPLLRICGRVAIGFADGADTQQVLDALLSQDGPLAGYEVVGPLGRLGMHLRAADGLSPGPEATEATLAAAAGAAGVAWSAPVFRGAESGLKQIATNEVIVRLEEDVDVQNLLTGQVLGWRGVPCTTDQVSLTIAGAGRVALDFAEDLMAEAGVVWAQPNFYCEVRKWQTDPLYPDQWHLNNTGQTGALPDADVDAAAGAPADMLALSALPRGRSAAGAALPLSASAGAGAGRRPVTPVAAELAGATLAAGADQEAERLPEGSGGRKASGLSLYARLGRKLPAVEAELNLLEDPDLNVLSSAI